MNRILLLRCDESSPTCDNIHRLFASGFLVLLGVTWPLWIPQTVFPQIPLITGAGRLSRAIETGLLGVLLAALASLLFDKWKHDRRIACWLTACSTLGLVCIDQHRLQPWVWQFLILSLVLAEADTVTARTAWRWLVIGIYAWSAWSKLDRGFLIQHGPFLLEGLYKALGLTNLTRFWSDTVRHGLAGCLPVFELLIACGLSWSRTQLLAVGGAAMMHVGLLLALGPLGHDHQPGVLVWNVFFLIQNWVLFGSRTDVKETIAVTQIVSGDDRATESKGDAGVASREIDAGRAGLSRSSGADARRSTTRLGDSFAKFVVAMALIWPVLEPLGYCDHWPAWAVYAAKPERVTVFLAEDELAKLPDSMKKYIGAQMALDEWYPLRIDRWSLDAVYVPLYPQDRFQVGVALGLARDLRLSTLRIMIESPAHWWTGNRVVHEYLGLEAVEKLADSYRCGAQPR